jgi:hypothetical protein
MTTVQAIKAAMKVFSKEKKEGDIRKITLHEGGGSGLNGRWTYLRILIEYSIMGDYTESDTNPFEVMTYENCNGKIVSERLR